MLLRGVDGYCAVPKSEREWRDEGAVDPGRKEDTFEAFEVIWMDYDVIGISFRLLGISELNANTWVDGLCFA